MLNFEEILKISADENKSCKYLQTLGVIETYSKCPYCGAKNVGFIRRCYYRCYSCGHEWSPRRGSILEKTRIKYGKLLMLVKLYDLGASAYKASKELKISETTVSRIYRVLQKKRLRKVKSLVEGISGDKSVSSDVTEIETTTETPSTTETTRQTIPTSEPTTYTTSTTETPSETPSTTETTRQTIPTSEPTTYITSTTETPSETPSTTETTRQTIPTSEPTTYTTSTTERINEAVNTNGKSSESEQSKIEGGSA